MTSDAAPAFMPIPSQVRQHARARPDQPALIQPDGRAISWQGLDELMDRIAAALQRDGVRRGEPVVLAGLSSIAQAAVFLGVLRAGAVAAPLAASVTPQAFAAMVQDAGARRLFVDATASPLVAPSHRAGCVALEADAVGTPFESWLAPPQACPAEVALGPDDPFNIIYSSGTTGTPKGIVQSHGMRHRHVLRGRGFGYGPDAVTLLSTPLYSNTTLTSFLPAVALGGTVVLMAKFDAAAYLALAERHRATHTVLVPVQYQRLMASPAFDRHDVSSVQHKFCTSAPFSAALKAEVLARWPGALTEIYGMTEGGGTCLLEAHRHPDKLHTVGRPAAGHDIRLVDDAGREVPPGEAGEVVGHSPGMMTGYFNRPELTREAEWHAPDGKRFIRTGDIGRFDADGFLILFDRKKDMIVSGGFNIYPSDLEAQLREHAGVADAAVVGVPSAQWGETPVAFVVRRAGDDTPAQALRAWLNERVGKTQRLHDLRLVDELPRSAIGKVLKRDLRDGYMEPPSSLRSLPPGGAAR